MQETSARSLVKTISWRIAGSSATFGISYFILGDITISGTIATIQLTFNTVLYYLHERAWDHIAWGRK